MQDENGAYLGFTWVPAHRWSINGYSDFSYFVWPKYHTKQSTQCWDHLLNILFQPNKRWTLGTRLRYKEKAGTTTGRWRLYATFADENWSAKTSVDYTVSKEMGEKSSQNEADDANPSQGYLLNENLSYRWHWLRLSGSFSYFHTQDFSSRIYVYEPGLLYQMSFSSFYGEGIRCALVARSEIGKHLMVIAKLGTTRYFDRSHISTGLQEIAGSHQTDLEIQIKWKW